MMLSSLTQKRILRDMKTIKENPEPGFYFEYVKSRIYEWYCIYEGSYDTPSYKGFYLIRIELPPTYPFAPPTVNMLTPNGRLSIKTSLCFSYTNYHPELWIPALNPFSVAFALRTYMNDFSLTGIGSETTSEYIMKLFAKESIKWSLDNKIVKELFPDVVEKLKLL